jgi:two-component system, NarL family, response regulator DevR
MLTPGSHHRPTDTRIKPAEATLAHIQILLVDDHPAVRLGARRLIEDQPDMRVVAEAGSVPEALDRLDDHIDVAIVDYHLGEGRDGLWLASHLKRREGAPHVLVYSAFADGALAVAALIAGADGLLGKHELGQELCRAIRRLADGRHHLPAVSVPVAQAMRSRLEPADQAIFGMLVHGISPDTIAERLAITDDELHTRRSIMLASLKPARPPSALPKGARSPLDYERPKRRASRRAA